MCSCIYAEIELAFRQYAATKRCLGNQAFFHNTAAVHRESCRKFREAGMPEALQAANGERTRNCG